MRGKPEREIGLLLLLVCAAAPVRASDIPGREFSAVFKFKGKQGDRQIGGTIVVDRYTPVEEAWQLAEVLKSQGQSGLAAALRGQRNGRLRLGALEYDLDLVAAKPTSKGFKLVVVTNRPIRYQETDQGSDSLNYPFGIVVVELDGFGRGEGRFYPAAALHFNTDGSVAVHEYSEGEGRVSEIKKVR
jgi:hypothetical protein